MQQHYEEWQVVKPINYDNPLSNICIRSKNQDFIVEKVIKITDRNEHYAYFQAQIMKQINSPHVARCLGYQYHKNHDQESISIFMPFYNNGDLEDYLKLHKDLSFSIRMQMFVDILVGLKELHTRLIIHRDLKLKNIFVDERGRCVVGDIGIAAVMEGNKQSQVGTPMYQAPQVYADKNYDEKVDIWATGILAYQIFNPLEGDQLPFPFAVDLASRRSIRLHGGNVKYSSYMKSTSVVKPFHQSVPEDLASLIRSMLRNRPEERIGWFDFYSSEIIRKYDTEMRLITFRADYQCVNKTKQRIKRYELEMYENQQKYFDPLNRLLKDDTVQQNMKKYPFLSKRRHQLHIFLYLLLRRALDRYQYIKQNRVFILINEFKPLIKKYKDMFYNMEQRINIWLVSHNQEQIGNNQRLKSSVYYEKLKGIVGQLLEEYSKLREKEQQ